MECIVVPVDSLITDIPSRGMYYEGVWVVVIIEVKGPGDRKRYEVLVGYAGHVLQGSPL